MIRNLKALGLALAAVFAMSAIGAGAAHAEKVGAFWTEGTKIDAVQGAEHPAHTFVTALGTLTCAKVSGSAKYITENESLTAEGINYETCHVVRFGITFPVTVTMNGCNFLFTAGTYTPATGVSHGSIHIENCTFNTSITIDIYNPGKPHTAENLFCLIHVPEQIIEGVTYTNGTTEGKMAVTVTANTLAVAETVTPTSVAPCNAHRSDNAAYTGSFWAKGTNASGEYVDTTMTEKK